LTLAAKDEIVQDFARIVPYPAWTQTSGASMRLARKLGLAYGWPLCYTDNYPVFVSIQLGTRMLSFAPGPNVTVASGATDSPAMISNHTISDAEEIACLAPAALLEVATIEISLDFDVDYELREPKVTLAQATAAATWEASTATMPAVGAHTIFEASLLLGAAWRVHLNGAAAADRLFRFFRRVIGG